MSHIVFSTIKENITSFFHKEDELLKQPKAVPEAASEVYEKPQAQKIIEKKLPEEQPKLPFSPDELRTALEKKKEEQPAPPEEHVDISHEISSFETTLQDAHETINEADDVGAQPVAEEPTALAPRTVLPKTDGFFSEFEQFMLHKDMESEGLLDKDLLQRMKEFHKHKQAGKTYYVYSKDVKSAMQRRLDELKVLEQEWFHAQQQIDELQRGLHSIEHEIESRTGEVKTLLTQAKSKSRLEQKAEPGNEFVLQDGRKLTSLLDLKIALRTIPTELFKYHVNAKKHDFAAWAQGGLKDKKLAKQIGKVTDKEELLVFLNTLAG